jgi:hypothetical protein
LELFNKFVWLIYEKEARVIIISIRNGRADWKIKDL